MLGAEGCQPWGAGRLSEGISRGCSRGSPLTIRRPSYNVLAIEAAPIAGPRPRAPRMAADRQEVPMPIPVVHSSIASRLALALGAAALGLGALAITPVHASAASEETPTTGTWTVHTWTSKHDQTDFWLEFSWRRERGSWGGRSLKLERIPGLTREQVTGKPAVAHFEIVRDAGTLVCDGHVGNETGAGLYELKLAPGYPDALARRGVGRPSREQHIRLALSDAGFAFLDELKKQGYPTPDLDQLMRLCDHGVDRDYVEGMSALGYRFDSFEQLVKARDHGVDPRYVQGMADEGFRQLQFEELLRARDHGVDPRYVEGMRELGFTGLSLAELIRARDHGVDPRYAQGMPELGYTGVPLDELVRARDHGVDPRYVEIGRASWRQ